MKELELILAAVANLGAAGKEAFIWWLVIDKVVTGAMILVAALAVPYMLLRFMRHVSARNAALTAIGKEVGVDFWYWAEGTPHNHSADDVVKAVKSKLASSK